MLRWDILKRRPEALRALTGLSREEFEELRKRFLPVWEEAERKRLSRPDRQRAMGAGRPYRLDPATCLWMTMMGMRLYLSTAALAARLGVDKATGSRNGRRILAVGRPVPEGEMEGPDPPSRGKDLPEMRATCPDWFAILDGTEQPIQRPADPEGQRVFYSGKKKRHTVQNGLVVNEEGLIGAGTPSTPGSARDRRPFRESGVRRRIPQEVGVIGDAGLDGLHPDLPLHRVATPHQARRHHPWTADPKWVNRELSRVRMVIEHVLAQIKPFRALRERFRHRLEIHDAILILVAAIVNRRTQERLALEKA